MRRFYPGIHARLILPFLLVSIIIAGVGVFIVTRLVAGSVQERFTNQLLDSAQAATNSIVEVERQQLALLRVMAYTEGVAGALLDSDADRLDVWLRPLAANDEVDELIVFDLHGQSILRLGREPRETGLTYAPLPSLNIGYWPGTRRVLEGEIDARGDKFIDVLDSASGVVRYYTSAPVIAADGQTVGGIAVGMDVERLAQRISEQSLSAVALYTAEGQVLSHTFRAIDEQLLQLTPERAAQLLAEAQDQTPAEQVTLGDAPYQRLFVPFQIRDSEQGLLAVGLPGDFLIERSSVSRDMFGALFAVLFLMVGVLGALMARSISRPVQRLVDTTRAIHSGDLSRRVGLSTPDELGELGRSFDHMTNQLVRQNRKINSLYHFQLEETARRDAVLSSIGDAVIVLNPTGGILLKNYAAENLIAQVAADPVTQKMFENIVYRPHAITEASTVRLSDRYFSTIAMPVHMQDGEQLGHVIVFRDITAIIESEKLKDELMMQMSHELRTPLTAIRGYFDLVQMLEAANLSEQGVIHLGGAQDYLNVLERLIGQVEDVSAILADRFAIEREPCNLVEVAQGQYQVWRRLMRERGLRITLTYAQDEVWVEGDVARLGQLFDHLLRNACSYTLPGGTVEMHVARQNGHVQVYIYDSGVGIAPDEIDRVFERMYRGRSADAGPTDSSGLGLGLYLAQYIAQAHHGLISLDSKLDQGTVVKVELPVLEREGSRVELVAEEA